MVYAQRNGDRKSLRSIAWLGLAAAEGGGAPYIGLQLLQGLRRRGVTIDCYMTGDADNIPAVLREEDGVRFFCRPTHWQWQRWYSRNPLAAFVTGQAARSVAQRGLMRLIAEQHARQPYDVLYQFSQIELFGVRGHRNALPPIVVHPGVHAAGELAWHRRESSLAARGESRQRRLAARAMLASRAARQRRDIRLVRRVIAPSEVFARHLAADYGVPLDRISIVPNPIDLDRFAPRAPHSTNAAGRPVSLVFVSRLAVRKGLDLVVALSHRLTDMAAKVRIEVIGDRSLWSDYRALLRDLNPAVAHYLGPLDGGRLAHVYAEADALIQPSKYEPFALTVGEALASGMPVVVSDEVGAAEGIDSRCCKVFKSGDLDAFERAVREMITRISEGDKPAMTELARSEALRMFSAERVADRVAESLELAMAGGVAG
jgi:glycosyltransferase involved in cell wall biosynthesis